VLNPLPPDLNFVSGPAGVNYDADTHTWSYSSASLTAGGLIDLAVTVEVDLATAPGIIITNTVSATSDTPDPDLSNNADSASLDVLTP
jgi:hypothetical protein